MPTFTSPCLDGSLNILDIIAHHGHESAAHPLFKYVDAGERIHPISWGTAVRAFGLATQYVMTTIPTLSSEVNSPPVVGILANIDSITYYSLIIGVMNAGFTPFPISPRNSAESVAHLLTTTNCQVVYVSQDPSTQRLAKSSFTLHSQQNPDHSPITSVSTPSFDDLYPEDIMNCGEAPTPWRKVVDQSTVCVIIHSSGTVSFPKPVKITFRMFFEHALMIALEGDACGEVLSTHATPMYHLMGLRSISYSAILGITLAVFRPCQPPIVPSPAAVLKCSVATSASRVSCPPSFVENWSTEPSDVEKLKCFDWIMFGGGPLDAATGDKLTKQGVNLMPTLGLTEVGPITSFFSKRNKSEDWSWFTFSPFLDLHFVKEEETADVYRMIVKRNAFKTPAILNTTVDGVPAYDTSDLYTRHPTNPRLWRIVGRADDQIMHSTGEKTNPVPIEAELRKSPHIANALMFGRAKFQPGVVIFPSCSHVVDAADFTARSNYIDLVWPHIVATNGSSPQHSRIFKEMIIIADPDRTCERTDKGTPRREITLQKYDADIAELYQKLEGKSEKHEINSPQQARMPEFEEVLALVQECARNAMGDGLKDEDDIFAAGADSLCALSIRNSIVQRIKASALLDEESIQALPRDCLYILPSISKLAAFVYGVIHLERTKVNNQSSRSKDTKKDNVNPEVIALRWQSILESKDTVVEIGKGKSGIPLIVLPGAPGNVETFPTFMKCTSAVWALQITDDTPQDSVEALALFYYRKIKAKQPQGPYRLASFSGSCVTLIELVLIFQRYNNTVSEFIMLDHFPTFYFPSLNPDLVEIDSPTWWESHFETSLRVVADLICNTAPGSTLSAQASMRRKQVQDAFNSGVIPAAMQRLITRTTQLIRMSLLYLLDDRFMVEVELDDGMRTKRWSADLFRAYVAGITPQLTVYLAKEGIKTKAPAALRDTVDEDLGARVLFPDATSVHIDGGHLDFLESDELIQAIDSSVYNV